MDRSAESPNPAPVRRSTVIADATPTVRAPERTSACPRWWWGFALFALVSAVHVGALVADAEPIVYPTKLILMPALALAALWALRGTGRRTVTVWLLAAIALSWLGDGAGFFFPFAPTLPMMLLCFGLAHIAYMVLFLRHGSKPIPPWTAAYALWWTAMLAVLWPHLGPLQLAVAIYGLVLGGTAALSARGGAITAVGGAFFLTSDTILAMRLFLPDEIAALFDGGWVMLTYTIGQGLIAWGIVRRVRTGG